MGRDDLVDVECDIWIPAARPDVLHVTNVERLRAKLVLPGANIPATAGAELWMHENGILYVPDFIANAGGVICAAVEHRGGTEAQAMAAIEEKIRANVTEVLARVRQSDLSPEEAAIAMARERIVQAESYHRFWRPTPPRTTEHRTIPTEPAVSVHALAAAT